MIRKICTVPHIDEDQSTHDSLFRQLTIDHYLWLDNGYTPEVRIALAYTTERLRLHYRVYEQQPKATYRLPNEPVHKDSCVEFFVQPLPDTDSRYLNFELNAAGTLLLKLGDNRHDRILLREPEPDAFRIRTATDSSDPIDGRLYWRLELSIPFAWLQTMFPPFRPERGHSLKGNFYKCGDETAEPHYGCWNPVTSATPDFHRSGDFGELRLG